MLTIFQKRILSAALATSVLAVAGCTTPSTNYSSDGMSLLAPAGTYDASTMRMHTAIRDEIYFDFNKVALTGAAQKTLDKYAAWMIDHPDTKFSVTGHADAIGSNDYNKKLGMQRAQVSVAYLISRGVSFKQLHAMVSLGEESLKVSTAAAEPLNRRVIIEVMERLQTPIVYADASSRSSFGGLQRSTGFKGTAVPVAPTSAINTPENVCGGSFVSLCASAQLLSVMGLDAQVGVSKSLKTNVNIAGSVDTSSPSGSVSSSATGNVGKTVNASADAVASVGGAVGGTVEKVGGSVSKVGGTVEKTVNKTVNKVGGTVGGLLGG
ncbi:MULTISPECIES: OmpA family protein [Halocynthiibacter]|uniref:OmpA family protein n=1 Tax=Halocynthiibacter halioticoli TaxID=2986804 RepID=A0AAE3LQA6_9RHOB|nr:MULTISPECIES: OmpA family protein [Halocynthiibacter]MCV6824262.1 OmpA family protein [Halocynthiibacter halioticoli]MCW4057263.1 OmpA family protein [Halocynthiibacter sp. SDUM655004]